MSLPSLVEAPANTLLRTRLDTPPRSVSTPQHGALAAHVEPALHVRTLVAPLPDEPLRVTDWRIEPGAKVAVIGRNGVGKSTLTETILGLRSGATLEGRMLGTDLRDWRRQPRLRKQLGVQLQRVFFPGRPRVSELVALHRKLYDRTSEHVLEALGISALSRRLYELLSRGETQRIDLFLALAHEPRMLFLDEPFTGLDPQFSRQLADLLRGLRDTTLLMCCHTPEELALTTHTAWLSRQGIVRHAETHALRRELVGDYRLVAHCTEAANAHRLAIALSSTEGLVRPPLTDGEQFTLVSAQPLTDVARQLADMPEVLSVDVGHSLLADLLRHCSKEHS